MIYKCDELELNNHRVCLQFLEYFVTAFVTIFNPFTPKSDLIDFTLSNAQPFYLSKGDPLGVKGLVSDLLYSKTK